MVKLTRKLVKYLLRIIFRVKAQGAISRLCNAGGVSKLLGDSIRETLQDDVAPDEKKWIKRIELLREELNHSTAEISIVSYGAGKPALSLTNEEMDRGRVVTRTTGEVSRTASKQYFWSLLLFKLIRKFRPSFCLELGTCLGISASFQAAALKLNGTGKIVTLEGSELLASLAKGHFQSLGLDNITVVTGRFRDTLSEVLNLDKSIDYAFIDGHHDEKATLAYFEQITPFLADGALLVFDDISWSGGMRRAWKTIISDERVKISVDLWQIGICIIDSRIAGRKNIAIPIA
jgi:cephalosporin hydroxylase